MTSIHSSHVAAGGGVALAAHETPLGDGDPVSDLLTLLTFPQEPVWIVVWAVAWFTLWNLGLALIRLVPRL